MSTSATQQIEGTRPGQITGLTPGATPLTGQALVRSETERGPSGRELRGARTQLAEVNVSIGIGSPGYYGPPPVYVPGPPVVVPGPVIVGPPVQYYRPWYMPWRQYPVVPSYPHHHYGPHRCGPLEWLFNGVRHNSHGYWCR